MSDSVWPHRRQPTRLPHPWDSPDKNTGVGCHFLLQCRKVKSESEVAQSCLTLSDPMDCSLPGSSVHGIFQARVLEWAAMAFSEERTLGPGNYEGREKYKKLTRGFLVAQWLRVHLLMQETWIWSLVWEDPRCHRATKPIRHNYRACALEPGNSTAEARVP